MLLKQISKLNLKVNLKGSVVDDASSCFEHSYKKLKEFNPKGKNKSIFFLELDTNLGMNKSFHVT
jgi:hypothetical protein